MLFITDRLLKIFGFTEHRAADTVDDPHFSAGIGLVDEGVFRDGEWLPGRRLNGDESDQGRYWRFDRNSMRIERCVVYRWE